jgi:hypothetical protein
MFLVLVSQNKEVLVTSAIVGDGDEVAAMRLYLQLLRVQIISFINKSLSRSRIAFNSLARRFIGEYYNWSVRLHRANDEKPYLGLRSTCYQTATTNANSPSKKEVMTKNNLHSQKKKKKI